MDEYDVIIIGGGASGSALLYTLAEYTDISKVLLLEKYDRAGQVNSKAINNSQTLHVGDIETNYSLKKVQQVYPAAMMVQKYAETLSKERKESFLFPTAKMVLGVGDNEVSMLENRFNDLKQFFPKLQKLSPSEIAEKEPLIVKGRENEKLTALYTDDGYAVNFEKLANQFIEHATSIRDGIFVQFNQEVVSVKKQGTDYLVKTKSGKEFTTKVLIINADSYSLYFAKQLGYGKEFSLIPIAGSFYFSKPILKSKVYTVQDPKLPFAAVHGDPDIARDDQVTRWGPTARFFPTLEAHSFKSIFDFLKSSGFEKFATWKSFFTILLDKTRFFYLLENMLYELPWIGKRMFIKNVRKIIPTMKASDVTLAKGYGGMRLQRVNTRTKELLLGEGKIVGDQVIINMTPSPGASVCLYNAMRDMDTMMQFDSLKNFHSFGEKMKKDLYLNITSVSLENVSQDDTYVS